MSEETQSKRVKCSICGEGLLTNRPSCTVVNGNPCHTKCIKKKRQEGRKSKVTEGNEKILDAILYQMREQNPDIEKLTDDQVRLICIQIAKLAHQGYDREVQLEAFKHYFNKGKEYMGYGIMLYVIENEVAEMEKQKKINKTFDKSSELSIAEMLDKQRSEGK